MERGILGPMTLCRQPLKANISIRRWHEKALASPLTNKIQRYTVHSKTYQTVLGH